MIFNEVRKAAREEEKKLIAEAENRGLEKGKVLGEKSGFEKGVKAGVIKMAKKLLDEGVAVEDVARVTELSVAEVTKIK